MQFFHTKCKQQFVNINDFNDFVNCKIIRNIPFNVTIAQNGIIMNGNQSLYLQVFAMDRNVCLIHIF